MYDIFDLSARLDRSNLTRLSLQEHRGLLTIRYPMEHGVVRDWNDMERIWQYIYSKDQLQTFAEEVSALEAFQHEFANFQTES